MFSKYKFLFLILALPPLMLQGSIENKLKMDPNIISGKLSNGLQYVVLPNHKPKERLSIRLFVKAGSIHETDRQKGMAHFLEHMAFNGTKDFPAGEMVKYFQRLGMAYGADTNAHTSFMETVYKLELPQNNEALIKESLKLIRNYADGILLEAQEIEAEKSIILSEKQVRDSVDYRTAIAQYRFLLPGSYVMERLPIGVESTIKSANQVLLSHFYKTWYTPDRMTLIVVGDIEPTEIISLIENYLGSVPSAERLLKDPDLGTIHAEGLLCKFHYEPEGTTTTVSLSTLAPVQSREDSNEKRTNEIYYNVINYMLTQRIGKMAKKEGSPFNSGYASTFEWLNFIQVSNIELKCDPDHWQKTLQAAEQELRRALEYGFTPYELEEAKNYWLNFYREGVQRAYNRKSKKLADEIAFSIGDNRVFTHPEADFDLAQKVLDDFKGETVHQAFKKLWDSSGRRIFISGNINLDEDSAQEKMLSVYEASRKKTVVAYKDREKKAFAYTHFGKPGTIVEKKDHSDQGICQIRFDNNVRLNLKKTDFEKNTIYITIRMGNGLLELPEDKVGLPLLAEKSFLEGGLELHSFDQLKYIFAGESVEIHFAIEADAIVLSGKTQQQDLKKQLQLLSAYIRNPGYRKEAFYKVEKNLDRIYLELENTPQGVMKNKVERFLTSEDYRFDLPLREKLYNYSFDTVRDWLHPMLQSGYMECSIVGDIDNETVISLVSMTLGALPERNLEKPPYAEERNINFPPSDLMRTFSYPSRLPKALVALYWPTDDIWDIQLTRRLNILAGILTDRLRVKIREAFGQSYSPYAISWNSDTFNNYGYILAQVESNPQNVDLIYESIMEIIHDLVRQPVTEDELQRILFPILNQIREIVKENRYWLHTVLSKSQEYPERIDWSRHIISDYTAITSKELHLLAKKYLSNEAPVLRVFITPDKTEK